MGYRYHDSIPDLHLPIPPVVEMKVQFRRLLPQPRLVAAVSFGCHVKGCAPFVADRSDVTTSLAGAFKRFCAVPPPYDHNYMADFALFIRRFLTEEFVPLPATTDLSLETYLAQARKPEWWKESLRRAAKRADPLTARNTKCKGFQKACYFLEPKHSRCINARSTEVKAEFAPATHALDTYWYSRPECLKKIPVHLRTKELIRRVYRSDAVYAVTDYSIYESVFIADLMQICEFEFYRYMWQHVLTTEKIELFCHILGGQNVIDFKEFRLTLRAKRMSGELVTSLGNSFTNLAVNKFLCQRLGSTSIGAVEGDDGLFSVVGRVPNVQDYERLGMKIKLEIHRDYETTSFCAMYTSLAAQDALTDPAEEFLCIGWSLSPLRFSNQRRLFALARAKGYALCYAYPACPCVRSLGLFLLRVTAGLTAQFDQYDWWDSQVMQDNYKDVLAPRIRIELEKPIHMSSRLSVEKNFGVSTATQILIEQYMDSLKTMQPLDCPALHSIMKQEWYYSWNEYVRPNATAAYREL